MSAALALAFGAGMVATINPCGFAMLPAYLSYFMGLRSEDASRSSAIRSAFAVGGLVSLGFLVVFGVAGLVISAGFRAFTDWIPWIALAVGVLVAGLGVAMVAGYEPKLALRTGRRGRTGEGWVSVFGFGVGYGVASLSCTLPVFLVAVAGQLTQRSVLGGLAVFLAYTAGMAATLLAVTIVLAVGKQGLLARVRAASGRINRLSGVILVLAGAFIVWFWTTEITAGAGALGGSPLFRWVESVQAAVLQFAAGRTLLLGVLFAAGVLAAGAYAFTGRNPRHAEGVDDAEGLIDAERGRA